MPARSSPSNIAFMIAILATSLALGPALAHTFELPHKIALSRDDYFVVQQIYAGWDRLAWVILTEIAAMIAVIILHWRDPPVRNPAIAALALVLAAQAVFWIWTFPANVATSNWTRTPDNWDTLRSQWEFSHLAGAVFQFLALMALTSAVLKHQPMRQP